LQEIVQSLPTTAFLVIVAFLGAMGAVALVAGLQARRRASLIEATETSAIGSAADGYCEIEGTIEAVNGRTLRTPLTGWQVCWYRASVEKYVWSSRRRGDGTWRSVRSATSSAPFLLRDSTGVCIVRPPGAEVTPTDKSVWYGAGPEPDDRNPPRLAPTQSTTPMVEAGWGHGRDYRYTEERIYPGDPMFVLGWFSRDAAVVDSEGDTADDEGNADPPGDTAGQPRPEGSLAEELEELASRITGAVIQKAPGKPFILSTTPQASHVAMTEFGSEAAMYLALLPFALAALLLWTRFN
jgi:hypothetical protein